MPSRMNVIFRYISPNAFFFKIDRFWRFAAEKENLHFVIIISQTFEVFLPN